MVSNTIEPRHAASDSASQISQASQQDLIVPPVDILEDPENYIFLADMPGVKPTDVDVTFENGVLTLEGRASEIVHREGMRVLVHEYQRGTYRRSFTLEAPINAEEIKATLAHGELTVQVPKAANAKTRKITVNAG